MKVKIDAQVDCFIVGEIYYIEQKIIKLITDNEWKLLKKDIQQDLEEYNKRIQKVSKKNILKKLENMVVLKQTI